MVHAVRFSGHFEDFESRECGCSLWRPVCVQSESQSLQSTVLVVVGAVRKASIVVGRKGRLMVVQ